MTYSVAIPQDIIYKIFAEVGDDERLLKRCALAGVSSSFLIPSRKQLFSKIFLRDDRPSQRLHECLIHNPVIQSFLRSITIMPCLVAETSVCSLNSTSLLAILRLPFCCLESFSIHSFRHLDWSSFSSELKDVISNTIHSSTLKTLCLSRVINVPITLVLGIVHLTKLDLYCISPCDFDGMQSSSLTPAASKGVASHRVIDQCEWYFSKPVHSPMEPIFLPFMCCPRYFEIKVDPSDFNILSFLMRSLCINFTSPASLEHLKFEISFDAHDIHWFKHYGSSEDLHEADVWRHLDSIITHPAGSRLQKVDINIKFDRNVWAYNDEVSGPVLDALPLLREKGVLFVEATVDHGPNIVQLGPWP